MLRGTSVGSWRMAKVAKVAGQGMESLEEARENLINKMKGIGAHQKPNTRSYGIGRQTNGSYDK